LNDKELIESLKKLISEKQKEIEALKTMDIQVGGIPQKVYKKLEHVNAQIEEKLNIVHKNYKKEIMKISEGFLKEIQSLKKDKQDVIDSIPGTMKGLNAKHKVEIE
jgi:hypothetical protein